MKNNISALPFPTSMLTKRLWHEEKLHSPLEHFGFFLHLNLVGSFLRFHILIQIATRTYGHQYTNTFIIIMCNFCFMSSSISLTKKFTKKWIYLLWMIKLIFNLLAFENHKHVEKMVMIWYTPFINPHISIYAF
jgi:hypothetical protein